MTGRGLCTDHLQFTTTEIPVLLLCIEKQGSQLFYLTIQQNTDITNLSILLLDMNTVIRLSGVVMHTELSMEMHIHVISGLLKWAKYLIYSL